ncbi:hypothetical protein AA0119_g9972 [Alternaria tenuissima]|jgi:hypothetical protein|uniref:Putative gamma-glutamylcyclotransferase n=1 Tax=Alternaria tenuissima TaxID=119927 RepID=A0ABY0G211_9PLEO|nr:hypothetical protein AA0119_g9972 [Alternaria tenuissima]RYO09047.1 hypothetical protein AA0121_g11116 [Alternaria tenuissima]
MEYLDYLDQHAMSAFDELNDDILPLDQTSALKLSSELRDLLHSTEQRKSPVKVAFDPKSNNMDYLFKISDPITPKIFASAAILPFQPCIIQGEGEDGIAQFCQISNLDIPKIKGWLAEEYPNISPVFVPINKARKALSPDSAYPTLGYDTTLPHHRPDSSACEYLPTQVQFPVWYFFYGTLGNSSFLKELFGSPPEEHALIPALIHGGKVKIWGGKYNALVDDDPESRVNGWAYEVVSLEQEDALRMYETAKYEVVRVEIELNTYDGKRFVKGCTFRFAGEKGELD